MAGSRKIPQSRVATPVQSVEKAVEWVEQEKLKRKARGVVVPLGAGGQAKGQRGPASRNKAALVARRRCRRSDVEEEVERWDRLRRRTWMVGYGC